MNIQYSIVGLPHAKSPVTLESVAQETDRCWDTHLPDGARVGDLIKHLGLPNDQIELIIVNGELAKRDTVLHDDDAVALMGPVSGD